MVASLVKIGGTLQPVEQSTHSCETQSVSHSLTDKLILLTCEAATLERSWGSQFCRIFLSVHQTEAL